MKKIASDIKLVFHSSTITMTHGPINIRSISVCGHSALLMKRPSRCVENRATVDRLPEDGISRCRKDSEQQLVRQGVTHGRSAQKLVNKPESTLHLFIYLPPYPHPNLQLVGT